MKDVFDDNQVCTKTRGVTLLFDFVGAEATMLREFTAMLFLLLSLLSLAAGSDVINVQLDESELDDSADR